MEKQKDILGLAKSVGFILDGKIDMKNCHYDHQYLYISQTLKSLKIHRKYLNIN